MRIFTFTGWSGTGKTTLISGLIRELTKRGLNVAAVKKVPEKHHLEPEGKDSGKFIESGAGTVYLVAERQLMKLTPITGPGDLLQTAGRELDAYDMILTEGFITDQSYIFELYDPQISKSMKTGRDRIDVLISDLNPLEGKPSFGRDEIVRIADHMETVFQPAGR